MKRVLTFAFALILSTNAYAKRHRHHAKDPVRAPERHDFLLKLSSENATSSAFLNTLQTEGARVEKLSASWLHVWLPRGSSAKRLAQDPAVEKLQVNFKITLLEDFSIKDPLRRAALARLLARNPELRQPETPATDNPAIPNIPQQISASPLSNSWSLKEIGTSAAWQVTHGNPEVVVAVLDTGIDYTHKDLQGHLWRNPKEIADNQVDDDGNGYVDDTIGWDFVSNDDKPFDLSVTPLEMLFNGGNPGHGTEDSGTIAAIAPQVKIMSLRLLSEKGQGNTADAIRAIYYAVDNGAKILSAPWSSDDDSTSENPENQALAEAIAYAQDHGVLFITPAGNGRDSNGIDNDSDLKPTYPASLDEDNIISVGALDEKNQLAAFSNWGEESVHLLAPGTDIVSLMPNNQASHTVVDLFNISANWDGTSMAAAHVAGAVALYWSAHLEKSAQDVKAALLNSVKKMESLKDKTLSGGTLDLKALLAR